MRAHSAARAYLVRSQMHRRRTLARCAPYVICTNPRSGSWLLSDGLAATRVAGNPREWFNTAEERDFVERWRVARQDEPTYADYLRNVRARSATSNGVRGVKVHHYQLAALPAKAAALPGLRGRRPVEIISLLFPGARYIWLTRQDKLRQAISLFRAKATDEWYALGSPGGGEPAPTDPVAMDAVAVNSLRETLVAADQAWAAFFAENRIRPLVITYEQFVADYEGTLRGVLSWLGLELAGAVEIPVPRLRRQADDRTERLLAEYATATPSLTTNAGR